MMVRDHGMSNPEINAAEKRLGLKPEANEDVKSLKQQAESDYKSLKGQSGSQGQ